jgi:hypothetical protein
LTSYKDLNREEKNAYQKAWRTKNRQAVREYDAWWRYGLPKDEFRRLTEAQAGLCAICGGPDPKGLCVDHDHQTGAVRGLLCHRCNFGLGNFDDDPSLLRAAAAYLG